MAPLRSALTPGADDHVGIGLLTVNGLASWLAPIEGL